MWLEDEQFKQVINVTPLISIDLVLRDDTGRILLGLRRNRPASGFWFVPGGRIFKNERVEDAFFRITQAELGVSYSVDNSQFLGVYQHLYDDCVFGADVDTHYVVLAFEIKLDRDLIDQLPKNQHQAFEWFSVEDLLKHEHVHSNTKDYFRPALSFGGVD